LYISNLKKQTAEKGAEGAAMVAASMAKPAVAVLMVVAMPSAISLQQVF
jgi:hypothetical protein